MKEENTSQNAELKENNSKAKKQKEAAEKVEIQTVIDQFIGANKELKSLLHKEETPTPEQLRQSIQVLIDTDTINLQGESRIILDMASGKKDAKQAIADLREYIENKYANTCLRDFQDLCKQAAEFNSYLDVIRADDRTQGIVESMITPKIAETWATKTTEAPWTEIDETTLNLTALYDSNAEKEVQKKATKDVMENLGADSRIRVGATLRIQWYGDVLDEIQQEQIDAGEPPYEYSSATFAPENQDREPSFLDLSWMEVGHEDNLPDGTLVTVIEDSYGEKFLDVEGIPMTPETANDTTKRERLEEESLTTGMHHFTAQEKLLMYDAFNEAIERWGAGAPTAKINLTDGISTFGGERDTYLSIRTFLVKTQWEAGIENTSKYDDLITQEQNKEASLTTEDERFREQILGYTGSEGIFQRDTLIEKIQNFWQNKETA